MNIHKELALTYDDVLLEPQYSEIESRSQVDISTELFGSKYSLPIISANMDTVTGPRMAMAMANAGGLAFHHRYQSSIDVQKYIVDAYRVNNTWLSNIIPSIGISEDDTKVAYNYRRAGARGVCIDIAHGHSGQMFDAIARIKDLCGKYYWEHKFAIIAGNVATGEGVFDLAQAGADVIKVGIGPSGVCSTRGVTGHGVPQLTALDECVRAARNFEKEFGKKIYIIADGGIRSSGDIVKALAVGADAVMVGGLLAGTDEAPGNGIYRGMASEEAQVNHHGRVNNQAAEGISVKVSPKGPVKDVLERLAGGIRSGLSYSGARNLKELREKAIFRQITHSGMVESTTYANKG